MANKASKKTVRPSVSAKVWSVSDLVQVLRRPLPRDREETVKLLKRQGILSRDGKLAKRYRTWGKRITHTPSVEQMQKV